MKILKEFFIRLWDAMKVFYAELSEKRLTKKGEYVVSDNMILPDSRVKPGDPFSRTGYILMNTPVVFENDIVNSTYHIIKIRKNNHHGFRFDLENVVTGHVARRVNMDKIRGLTAFENSKLKEHLL